MWTSERTLFNSSITVVVRAAALPVTFVKVKVVFLYQLCPSLIKVLVNSMDFVKELALVQGGADLIWRDLNQMQELFIDVP